MRLLAGHPIRPGEQLFVLADLAADDAVAVRGAVVVRADPGGWEVPAAGVDTRWPPVGAQLAEQVLAAAAAAGARRVRVGEIRSRDVAAGFLRAHGVSLGAGGRAVIDL